MVKLNDKPRKAKYTTSSISTTSFTNTFQTYDVLVIRDNTGTVARFEQMRGDRDYVEYLDELLNLADGIGEVT